MPRRTENAERKIAGVKCLKIGVKNILIGVALIGGAGILLHLFFGRPNIVGMISGPPKALESCYL
jgi:hypothetical protein